MRKYHWQKLLGGILSAKKIELDTRELRKAGIGVLIEDERWDRLFSSVKKSPSIIKTEQTIRDCLDEKIRLRMETNINNAEKQVLIERINKLAAMDSESGGENARAEIEECDAKLRSLIDREPQIEQRNGELDDEIQSHNYALLEDAVSYLYQYMKKSQARVSDLDGEIDNMRDGLKDRIDERASLAESINETYNFLHGLLGAKQIESLDIHYTLD